MDSNFQWTKWLLFGAALWNIVGGVGALLDPAQHFATLYTQALDLSDPLTLFFYRVTWINVIAWGLGYFIAALRSESRVAILSAGAIGKSAYFLASCALYADGVGRPAGLLVGSVDLLTALAFALIVYRGLTIRR